MKFLVTVLRARLAGKYRWREFPAVITGNYRPGKYSKFGKVGNTGRYEIYKSCLSKNILQYFHKLKLTADISYCLCTYNACKL